MTSLHSSPISREAGDRRALGSHPPAGRVRLLASAGIIALLGALNPSVADTTTYDCDTTFGWFAVNDRLEPTADTKLSAADGHVVFEYPRGEARILVHHGVSIRGFEKLAIRVRSEKSITLGISLEDRDEAEFYALKTLVAGEWTTVELTPGDFLIGDDSPVRKERLDSDLLGEAYVLVDIAFFLGGSGRNTLEFDSVEITRP